MTKKKHPNSPRPSEPQAEAVATDEDLERTSLSTSDEDVGEDRIDKKGIDDPGNIPDLKLHAKPLSDED
jgi:hypothetical protein